MVFFDIHYVHKYHMNLVSALNELTYETQHMNSHKIVMKFLHTKKIFYSIAREYRKIPSIVELSLLLIAEKKYLQIRDLLDSMMMNLEDLVDDLESIRFYHEEVSREIQSKFSIQKKYIVT